MSRDIPCVGCQKKFCEDAFDPRRTCSVCREPTRICRPCQENLVEFHCQRHWHLRNCYFSDLRRFSEDELKGQLTELESTIRRIAVGRRFRQRRRTLQKQCEKVATELDIRGQSSVRNCQDHCRNCGQIGCDARCWGLGKPEEKELHERDDSEQAAPKSRRDRFVEEAEDLMLATPPSAHRDPVTGIRVPPPCTRVIRTAVKRRWCDRTLLEVVSSEFTELSRPGVLDTILELGLLHVNSNTMNATDAADYRLESSDAIGRKVHWHEPPVIVPETIDVQRIALSPEVLDHFEICDDKDDCYVYVCNKPSTIPVHPVGTFVANSLTMMVEAQEKFPTRSLDPIHRTDRVTSGLTLCCRSATVCEIFRKSLSERTVSKIYLAKVHGRFPSSANEFERLECDCSASCSWLEKSRSIRLETCMETSDPTSGIRVMSSDGRPSRSLFRLLKYDLANDTSFVLCRPLTGRSHQLRVHLQSLGFPIVGDIQYGGKLDGSFSELSSAALKLMTESVNRSVESSEAEHKLECLSAADVYAARMACPCCKEPSDGIWNSFTSAQLLQGGHAISLHALKYRLMVFPKNERDSAEPSRANKPCEPLAVVDFEVEPPSWFDDNLISDVDWLDDPSSN